MTDTMKKILVIASVVASVAIVILLSYFVFRQQPSPSASQILERVNFEGADRKVQSDDGLIWETASGNVRINNIFKDKTLTSTGELVLAQTDSYSIVYKSEGDFIEVLISEPLKQSRLEAHQRLSQLLGVTTEICKLPIEVYSKSADADLFRPGDQINYGLDGCEGAIEINE